MTTSIQDQVSSLATDIVAWRTSLRQLGEGSVLMTQRVRIRLMLPYEYEDDFEEGEPEDATFDDDDDFEEIGEIDVSVMTYLGTVDELLWS